MALTRDQIIDKAETALAKGAAGGTSTLHAENASAAAAAGQGYVALLAAYDADAASDA